MSGGFKTARFFQWLIVFAWIASSAAPVFAAQGASNLAGVALSGTVADFSGNGPAVSNAVRMATLLTVLSVLHAFGMPETPPTPALISLALFLTAFAMMPALQAIHHDALTPFMNGQLDLESALEKGAAPLREFMLRQVRPDELKLMYELSHTALPSTPEEVSLLQLTPAFILNELRVAFQIGFVVLLPFLLIDLVVSSVLLSLGMLMVPPATISLPLKVLMFVLVDGWGLVLRGVLSGFK